MQTIAIANAKGGVGKTTLTVHLAVGLAGEGHRVLVVDLDPQSNATQWLVGKLQPGSKGIADCLIDEVSLDGMTLAVPNRDNIWLTPSTEKLTNLDFALASSPGGQLLLRHTLSEQQDRYDFVLIDCPPNLGLSVLSALCAADWVVAPVQAAFLSLAGLERLNRTVKQCHDRLNVPVEMLGFVLFAADGREAITQEVSDTLAKLFKDLLFESRIRVSTAAKALPATKETAWDSGADLRGRADYQGVLAELSKRLTNNSMQRSA